MNIHHFGIEVTDIDRSIDFYTQKLGFKIIVPKSLEKDVKVLYANLGYNEELTIELIQNLDKPQDGPMFSVPPLCPHIGFETHDFEATLKMLQENGVAIYDGPHEIPGDVKMLSIVDPDNYRLDIGQLL